MTVHVALLGGFALRRDDRPLALPTRKTEALLALLAVRPGAPQSRDRLAALLWPSSAEAQARGSLRQALAQLRRALEPADAAVMVQGDAVALDPAILRSDVAAFEAAAAAGDTEAAALFAGNFLEGFVLDEEPFEEWRRAESHRLRGVALDLLARLAAGAEPDAAAAAFRLGERLLALDATCEEAHRALMRLHLARGDRAAALRQYERCQAALKAELGIAPGPETEALRREARRAEPRAAAEPSDAVPSIAVLAFANLSSDPEQGYFAQGIAEDIIRELSRFRSLRVIASHSSFALAGSGLAPQEIAARLGARYLLSGSVRRGGEAVRIGTELIDAASGSSLWADRYDAPLSDLFALQDEITRKVAVALAVRIDDQTLRQARRKPAENLQAYDCWLRGIDCLRRATPESGEEARALFRRALEADPQNARAFSGLSLSYFNDWSCLAWDRWDENERQAFDYARKAVAIDEADHVTQFILGRILLYRRDFERAVRHLERAEALNANDADILVQLGLTHAYLGDPERGIALADTAMRLNPFHDDWYYAYAAMPYFGARRVEEALALGSRAPEAATDMPAYLAACQAHLGRTAEARREAEAFLDFYRRNITGGRTPEPEEPVRWMLRVNPYRRSADVAFLLDGLARAGLRVPAEARRFAAGRAAGAAR